jgi:diguanylate cyclase (GGDEF)-like protein/PAS domain S-box-containing protein
MDNTPIRVLLVDDDGDVYDRTRGILAEAGPGAYQLERTASDDVALDAMARHAHDVYLIDCHLNARRAAELLSKAAARALYEPVILLTGRGRTELDATQEEASDRLDLGRIDRELLERSIRYSIERAQALGALRASEERYALVARGARDGLWDWNLRTDRVYFSPRWRSMLGEEEVAIEGAPDHWFGRVHPDELARVQHGIDAHRRGETPHFEVEHRLLHRDGSYRRMLARGLAVRDAEGKAYRMAGSLTDVTDRQMYDPLTGTPNRALFMDRLGQAVQLAMRHRNYMFAVLLGDIDHLRAVNENLGHHVGDQLISSVAHRLEACLRPGNTVARLGGDDIAILLEDVRGAGDATRVAARLQEALDAPFTLSGHEIAATASIGIALSSSGYERAQDLLRDADTAMRRAKAIGGARYELFDQAMHAHALALLELESDLQHAIERRELLVYYQPILQLATGELAGFEALVRWQHPRRGLLPPAEFIPVAEETGLIIPLGLYVLSEACREMRAWAARHAERTSLLMSVNLSSKQFTQPDLVARVAQILAETDLPATNLELEITESVVMDDPDSTAALLEELRNLEVHVAIDDFGTGYSSLSYLQRFPVDTLKIDRSFVSKVGEQAESLEIVRAITTLAHALDLRVVAEGVETSEQLAQLQALQCEYGQGYLFSPPLDSTAAERPSA